VTWADDDSVEAPLLENRKDFVLAAFFGDEEHALLRFAEQIRKASCRFALGTLARSISMPVPPREAIPWWSSEPAAPMS